MSNVELASTVDLLVSLAPLIGAVAGFVGVASAVYLQLLAEDRVPPVYIGLFFVLGSGMILSNITAVPTFTGQWADLLPAVGNLVILVFELVLFRQVFRHTQLAHPILDASLDDGRV